MKDKEKDIQEFTEVVEIPTENWGKEGWQWILNDC